MLLIGIFGGLGAGKTLTMTYLLLIEKVENKRTVVTNYSVKFADKIIKCPLDIEELEDCALGLDELWLWLDSANFLSNANRVTRTILARSRKVGMDIYFTTQSPLQVDARLRRIVDYWILPEYRSPERCYYSIYDPALKEIVDRKWFRPKPIFELYNTREVIRPPSYFEILERMLRDREAQIYIAELDTEAAVDVLAEKYPLSKRVLRGFVKYIKKKKLLQHFIRTGNTNAVKRIKEELTDTLLDAHDKLVYYLKTKEKVDSIFDLVEKLSKNDNNLLRYFEQSNA